MLTPAQQSSLATFPLMSMIKRTSSPSTTRYLLLSDTFPNTAYSTCVFEEKEPFPFKIAGP